MSVADSLRLLDRTARQTVPEKRRSTRLDAPPVLERLKLSPPVWCALGQQLGSFVFDHGSSSADRRPLAQRSRPSPLPPHARVRQLLGADQ